MGILIYGVQRRMDDNMDNMKQLFVRKRTGMSGQESPGMDGNYQKIILGRKRTMG